MRQSSRELDGKPRRKMRGGVLQRADLFKLVLRKLQCKMAEVMLSSQLNSSKISSHLHSVSTRPNASKM